MLTKKELANSKIIQLYTRATAPCRDYYGLTIGENFVCVNLWQVTHSRHAAPKQRMSDFEDLKDDKQMQEEIKNMFGLEIYDYLISLAYNERKLENIPIKLFLNVLKYVDVNDILRMFTCSKIFYELCNSDEVWALIFIKKMQRAPSKEESWMAIDCGWKEVLKRRLAFIMKAFKKSRASNKKDQTTVKTKYDKDLVKEVIGNKKTTVRRKS